MRRTLCLFVGFVFAASGCLGAVAEDNETTVNTATDDHGHDDGMGDVPGLPDDDGPAGSCEVDADCTSYCTRCVEGMCQADFCCAAGDDDSRFRCSPDDSWTSSGDGDDSGSSGGSASSSGSGTSDSSGGGGSDSGTSGSTTADSGESTSGDETGGSSGTTSGPGQSTGAP